MWSKRIASREKANSCRSRRQREETKVPQIKEIKEIPMTQLVIGKGQVRVSDVSKEVEELAESIAKVGLLEPIVVAPPDEKGRYEILTGQRRFLAHRHLNRDTILAAVLDSRVDETMAKVISVTENLVRRDLNSKDLIDACTALFKKYGSVRTVADETGLPYVKVAEYVKYDRLKPEMRTLVDSGEVKLKTALRAQDAATVTGDYQAGEAVKLAKEMASMTGAQQMKLAKERRDLPEKPVDEAIEAAKTGAKITQVLVTLGAEVHQKLQAYAKQQGTTQDDAAASLIEDGLGAKGFLEEP
jgi:ParB family chromosome partitioning protein